MEDGPHEEAKYAAEEIGDDESELLSTHSPDEDYEEPAEDEDEACQSKRARHNKGDSASASSPTKHVADPEVTDTGSSSPSVKESTELQDLLNVDPPDSASPLTFGRLPSISLGSEEDEELRLVNIRLCLLDFFLLILTLFYFAFLVANMALLLLHMPRSLLPAMSHKRSSR